MKQRNYSFPTSRIFRNTETGEGWQLAVIANVSAPRSRGASQSLSRWLVLISRLSRRESYPFAALKSKRSKPPGKGEGNAHAFENGLIASIAECPFRMPGGTELFDSSQVTERPLS